MKILPLLLFVLFLSTNLLTAQHECPCKYQDNIAFQTFLPVKEETQIYVPKQETMVFHIEMEEELDLPIQEIRPRLIGIPVRNEPKEAPPVFCGRSGAAGCSDPGRAP